MGDVLGAPFEGRVGVVPASALASVLDASSVLPYTDDTTLTVALAESVLRVGGVGEEDLAVAFAEAWAAAPDLGYSTRTAALLRSIHGGGVVSRLDVGHGRASNGAAMRVAPVALWAASRLADAAELARRSAGVTHDHPGAVEGAADQAVTVAAALCHPVGAPLDAVEFVAAVRLAVADSVLTAKLDVVAELARRGAAGEIAARIGAFLPRNQSRPRSVRSCPIPSRSRTR